jgi:hypothetical protein
MREVASQEQRKMAVMHNLSRDVKTNSLEAVKIGAAVLIGVGLGRLLVGQRRARSARFSSFSIVPNDSLDQRFDELAQDRSEEIVGATRQP